MSATDAYDDTFSLSLAAPATGFRWEFHAEGEGRYEVSGACPRCGCAMTKVWPYGRYGAVKGPDDAAAGPWFTRCTCAGPHAGRPAEERRGCGAGLWIALPPNGLPS